MATLTRTIEIDDLTPDELAAQFCYMNAKQQAQFFSTVGAISATWPGAGMCMQALAVSEELDKAGRYVIERLADHAGLIPEVAA